MTISGIELFNLFNVSPTLIFSSTYHIQYDLEERIIWTSGFGFPRDSHRYMNLNKHP